MGSARLVHEGAPASGTGVQQVARWYAPRLDVIRFGAFALVFLGHNLAQSSFVPDSVRENTGPAEVFGVIIFFVLSAYLIGRLLLIEKERTETISLGRYWRRRSLRIWPLYFFIVLGAYAIAPLLRTAERGRFVPPWSAFPGWMTFVENWAAPPATYIGMFWTVCVEEQVYFVFPLILLLSFQHMRLILVAMIVSGPVACYLTVRSGQPYPAVWNFTTSHLDSFGLGLLLALLDTYSSRSTTRWTKVRAVIVSRTGIAALIAGTAAYVIGGGAAGTGFYTGTATSITYITASLIASGWVLVASGRRRLTSKPGTLLAWLGRRGYGLYAWHWPMLLACIQIPALTQAGRLSLAGLFVSLGATVILAVLSYRYLEVPFLRQRLRFQVVSNRL